MKNFILSHHLGLGDMIILNGLVRHIYASEMATGCDKFYLVCFLHNEKNVRYLYRDLPNLELIIVEEGENSGLQNKINEVGGTVENINLDETGQALYQKIGDDAFFEKFGYDKKLIQKFHILRDEEKERKALNETAFQTQDFIFVHDDFERGYKIEQVENQNYYPLIRAPKEIPIFELLSVLEKAKEIHVISSAFLCLCIAIPELAKKTTAHLYIRNAYLKNYVESKGIKVLV